MTSPPSTPPPPGTGRPASWSTRSSVRGERFPFAAPDAEGFTLGSATGEVDRYRALLEGVAFVERLGYERLAGLGAPADPPIAVSGGGSGSPVWNAHPGHRARRRR